MFEARGVVPHESPPISVRFSTESTPISGHWVWECAVTVVQKPLVEKKHALSSLSPKVHVFDGFLTWPWVKSPYPQ